jgi:hypothetical protein
MATTITESSPAAVIKAFEATPVHSSTASSPPLSVGMDIAYERFLEMPVAFVLGVSWLAGVALMGSCALLLYLVVSALI